MNGPAIDFGAVMEQVHYAFRQQGGAWRGGHTTYDVAVQPDGLLEVKPWHHPNGRPEGAEPPAPTVTDPGALGRMARPASGEVIEGSGVAFAPPVVTRGGALLASGPTEGRNGAAGQLLLPRGAVTEELRNGPDGVEQSWRFAEPPAGSGALEVRIALATGEFTAEAEDGLHFTAGTLGVRYGHGTWVDAFGNSTRVESRWEEGAIVLKVPPEVLEGSVYPAVLDPVIGPEQGVSDPVYGPAKGIQSSPAVAWDGTNHFVVWEDLRSGTSYHIHGARVRGSDGEVLDPAGIAISTVANGQSPALAWDGTNHLVVWTDYRSGANDIYGARVRGSDGVVLDASGIAISTAANDQGYPAVAWDGTNHLVVWRDYRSGTNYDIYGARVTGGDGAVLDASGIAISTAANDQGHPALAWDGTNHLVVWQDYRSGTNYDIYGARVRESDGAVLDASGIAISTAAGNQENPALAWDGTNHLVVWEDSQSGTSYDIYGARVRGSDGVVLDATGVAISTAASTQAFPAVAWDGANHLVVWMDFRSGTNFDIYGARVRGSDGAVLDASAIAISTAANEQSYPAVAWDGTNHLAVWQDYRSSSSRDIYGARVRGSDGSVIDASGIAISTAPNNQSLPAVAWDGTNHLVVWQDYRSGTNYDLYAARVRGTDGALLDASGIAISTAASSQLSPAVAWDGTNYLVTWHEVGASFSSDIFGARVRGSDGAVLDTPGIAISTGANEQSYPAVAWDGTNHLVVWSEYRSGLGYGIYGARVRGSDGAVLDASGFAISTPNYQQYPAVAWDGTNHLVVWQDIRGGTSYDISGARVRGSDGAVLDASGISISTAANYQQYPAVAWDGTNHLVVWQDLRSGTSYDIYGARVRGSDGALLDASGIAISMAASDQSYPAVACDGTSHLVVWEDLRSGTNYDIFGSRVTPAGAVLDSGGFAISTATNREQNVAVAPAGPRRFRVLYESFYPMLAGTRVNTRLVDFTTPPVADEKSGATPEDSPLDVTLSGSDDDGDALTFAVASVPAHGSVTIAGSIATYTPAAEYSGDDSFTYVANDGLLDSAPATVSITVVPVNDAPVAADGAGTVAEDGSVGVTLAATDVEGDALTYAVVTPPVHGAVSIGGNVATYTPALDYFGADTFTFKANDGSADSNVATVSLTVSPVNDAPVATDGSATVAEDTSAGVTLAAADIEGDTLTYSVVAPPSHGTVSIAGSVATYTPAADFNGADAFTFRVNDGAADSNVATVTLTVTPVDEPASGGCGCSTGGEMAPISGLLVGLLAFRRRRSASSERPAPEDCPADYRPRGGRPADGALRAGA